MTRVYAYRCDEPGCGVTRLAVDKVVRAVGKSHYCPDHFPVLAGPEHCSKCHRPVRPYTKTLEEYPGTIAKASSSPALCSSCYVAPQERPEQLNPDNVRVVLPLLERSAHDAEDLAWLKFCLLGIDTSKSVV